jgi:hypothetical protein
MPAGHKELRERIKKELDDYPDYYNAHKDSLGDMWDMRQSVNNLLHLLREAYAAMEKK